MHFQVLNVVGCRPVTTYALISQMLDKTCKNFPSLQIRNHKVLKIPLHLNIRKLEVGLFLVDSSNNIVKVFVFKIVVRLG